jgi:hypothetical protein
VSVTRDPATEVLLANVASMPFDFQGTSNACGTRSLAMVMSPPEQEQRSVRS